MTEPGTRGPAERAASTPPAARGRRGADGPLPSRRSRTTDVGSGADWRRCLEEPPAEGLRGRVLGFRFHLPRTRRGIFALLLVVGAFAFAGIWTSVTLVHWTETADFCGRCHQMGPELVAYESGPHRDVTCGECHVEPGVDRLGQGQAERHPTADPGAHRPLPAADPAARPRQRCPARRTPARSATRWIAWQSSTLVTRTQFTEDETNTRAFVGPDDPARRRRRLRRQPQRPLARPAQTSSSGRRTRTRRRSTTSPRPMPDGTVEEYIAQDKIKVAEDVQPEIDAIKAAEKPRTMDCIQCHNRVGHPIPNPRHGLDNDLMNDRIDPDAPLHQARGDADPVERLPGPRRRPSPRSTSSTTSTQLEYPAVASRRRRPRSTRRSRRSSSSTS